MGGAIMKRFKSLLLCLIFIFVAVLGCCFAPRNNVYAAENTVTYEEFSSELNPILTEFCANYKTRIAGSENERDAAGFIQGYLEDNTNLVAKYKQPSIRGGVQSFQFKNQYTGIYNTSQNLVYVYNATVKSGKKVILCCNYDAPLKYDEESGEYVSYNNDALNASAAGVVSLLMIARNIYRFNFNFDIEFVFFGAGENSCAGSEFYLNGLSEEEKKNILCVVNVDKIGLGKNIYFYNDEIATDFSSFVADTCSSFVSEINLNHLNKSNMVDTKLNLGYSHIALDSDNVNFMDRGITTLNLFAGEYEDGVILGRNEYNGKGVVTYTNNDTIAYINENYGTSVITDNIYKVSRAVETLFLSDGFVAAASSSQNSTSWFYKLFANEKLSLYLTILAFFVILIITMYIYYKLTAKSYYANVEVEFLSSVVKISDHIEEGGANSDVSKVVGQVLANDIKKSKTLKSRKKNRK